MRPAKCASFIDPCRLPSPQLHTPSSFPKSIKNTEPFQIHPPPHLLSNTNTRHKSHQTPPPPGLIRRTFPTFPWHTLPNILTYLRCLAIPLLLLSFYYTPPLLPPNQQQIPTTLIFILSSITDFLDGYLARRWQVTSPFGAFLDPVADKLMVGTTLIALSGLRGAKVAIPCMVILGREVGVSALREWMAERGLRDVVKVGWWGKVKTCLTMVALGVLLLVPHDLDGSSSGGNGWVVWNGFGMVLLYASAILTVTSGVDYFRAASPILMGDGVDEKEEEDSHSE